MLQSCLKTKVYLLPNRYLYLSQKNLLDFWDFIYCLAAYQGAELRVSVEQFALQTKGVHKGEKGYDNARQIFYSLWKKAVNKGELEGGLFGRSYEFAIPGYARIDQNNCTEKPVGYVMKGWLPRISTANHKRVLNFFFFHSRGYSRNWETCIEDIRHAIQSVQQISMARNRVKRTLQDLLSWNILVKTDEHLELNYQVFENEPPDIEVPKLNISSEQLTKYYTRDLQSAKRTEDIIKLANLSRDNFSQIFEDVRRFEDYEYAVLIKKAQAWKDKRDPQKWFKINAAANAALTENDTQLRSKRVRLAFWRHTYQKKTTHFGVTLQANAIESIQAVCELRTVPAYSCKPGEQSKTGKVHIQITDADDYELLSTNLVITNDVDYKREEIDLTRDFMKVRNPEFFVVVGETNDTIDWLEVIVYLELRPYSMIKEWEDYLKIAQQQVACQIAELKREKYHPQLYSNRVRIEERIYAFLQSDNIGLIVIGDSGVGKTNLLCHLAEKLQSEQ